MKLLIDISEEYYKEIVTERMDGSHLVPLYIALITGEIISRDKVEDDAISRQAALESIKNLYPDMPVMDIMGARRKWLEKFAPYFECENAVEQLPSVKQEPKKGHWIEHKNNGMSYIECSKCSTWFLRMYLTRNSYCPNCGARMESEE